MQMLRARLEPLMQRSCFNKNNLQVQQGYELMGPSIFHNLRCKIV